MKMINLCKLLGLNSELEEKLAQWEELIDFNALEFALEQMKHPESWDASIEQLKSLLGDDEDGMKILTCQLHCVCEVYDRYKEKGISEEIFVDTMKFFTRFLEDHKNKHGFYRYVWAWWAVREISMVEFRIGELEYEMRIEDHQRVIDIHIPADADMTLGRLRDSYDKALIFFEKFYPDYNGVDMVCNSWLLAPSLKYVLPENSRILQFQRSFHVEKMEVDSIGFMDWVYGSRDIPIEELPEDTSLRKKLKPYLRNNGKIEWTFGRLITNPFCEKV